MLTPPTQSEDLNRQIETSKNDIQLLHDTYCIDLMPIQGSTCSISPDWSTFSDNDRAEILRRLVQHIGNVSRISQLSDSQRELEDSAVKADEYVASIRTHPPIIKSDRGEWIEMLELSQNFQLHLSRSEEAALFPWNKFSNLERAEILGRLINFIEKIDTPISMAKVTGNKKAEAQFQSTKQSAQQYLNSLETFERCL